MRSNSFIDQVNESYNNLDTELTNTNNTYTQIDNTIILEAYIDNEGNYGRYWHGSISSFKVFYIS